MDKIPTAEEFINSNLNPQRSGRIDIIEIEHSVRIMIEFAKLHVEAALKAASENVKLTYDHYDDMAAYVDRNSILNAYPSDNIK
jgi:hypothetical protein